MMKRALLIGSVGSNADKIEYAPNSVACFAALLETSFGFDDCVIVTPATRKNILACLDAFVSETPEDSVAVIYYCGHSGTAPNLDPAFPQTLPAEFHYIEPIDYDREAGDETPWRGILEWELELRFDALTKKTSNVTLVLDTCMAENIAAQQAGVHTANGSDVTDLSSFLQPLVEQIRELRTRKPNGDPDVVRILASTSWSEAFAAPLPGDPELAALGISFVRQGDNVGALTIAITKILAALARGGSAAETVSWRMLLPALKSQYGQRSSNFEGPIGRVPFSTKITTGSFAAMIPPYPPNSFDHGSLVGVSVGDIYGLIDATPGQVASQSVLAELTVNKVTPTEALFSVDDGVVIPDPAAAIPLSTVFARYPIAIAAPQLVMTDIADALGHSALVRVATGDEIGILATIHVANDALEIDDVDGLAVARGRYPDDLAAALVELDRLATVTKLRSIGSSDGWTNLSDISVELLRNRGGAFEPIRSSGELLSPGDRFAFRLVNTLPEDLCNPIYDRYVNLVLIDPTNQLVLLNDEAKGIFLDFEQSADVPDPGQQVDGFSIAWPSGLDTSRPCTVRIAVVISTEAADIRVLESARDLHVARERQNPFEELMDQVATGSRRTHRMPNNSFHIEWLDFLLAPLEGSLALQSPAATIGPMGWANLRAAAPHRFRVTASNIDRDIRVDVVVCARCPDRPWDVATLLPGRSAVVWEGEAHGTVDVFVWTSAMLTDRVALRDRMSRSHQAISILRASDDDPKAQLASAAALDIAHRAEIALGPWATLAFHGVVAPGTLRGLLAPRIDGAELMIERIR